MSSKLLVFVSEVIAVMVCVVVLNISCPVNIFRQCAALRILGWRMKPKLFKRNLPIVCFQTSPTGLRKFTTDGGLSGINGLPEIDWEDNQIKRLEINISTGVELR